MDGQRFDHLARMLAGGLSRRAVLRGAAAGLAGAVGLRAGRAGAGQEKKPLCHATGDPANPWVVISVAEPAWPTHYAHGDRAYVDCCDHADCAAPATCGGGGVDGQCGAPGCSTDVDCGLNDACTTHRCDTATGNCVHAPVPDPSPSTDPCNPRVCDPTLGWRTVPVDCDDDNPCTIDSCDPTTGACVHTPKDCADSNACTDDSCDPQTGLCVHTPKVCDDGIACTFDRCDPVIGCVHTPVHELCSSPNPCFVPRCDPTLGCVLDPKDCDDHNPCTIDSCVAGQCQHEPGNFCNDGLRCTDDVCVPSADGQTFTCEYVFDPTNCGPLQACQEALCGLSQDCVIVNHDDRCPAHPSGASCLAPNARKPGAGSRTSAALATPTATAARTAPATSR